MFNLAINIDLLYITNITIAEFQGPDGYTDEIIISGPADEKEFMKHAEDWCETNNSLIGEINHVGDHFIAQVSPDDYK